MEWSTERPSRLMLTASYFSHHHFAYSCSSHDCHICSFLLNVIGSGYKFYRKNTSRTTRTASRQKLHLTGFLPIERRVIRVESLNEEESFHSRTHYLFLPTLGIASHCTIYGFRLSSESSPQQSSQKKCKGKVWLQHLQVSLQSSPRPNIQDLIE